MDTCLDFILLWVQHVSMERLDLCLNTYWFSLMCFDFACSCHISIILTLLFSFVHPGPDHSKHTWLRGAVPAWHHIGHLHWPGISDVTNTHYHSIQEWKLQCREVTVLRLVIPKSLKIWPATPKEYEPIIFSIVNNVAVCKEWNVLKLCCC